MAFYYFSFVSHYGFLGVGFIFLLLLFKLLDCPWDLSSSFDLFLVSALDASFEASLFADPSNISNFLLICTLVSELYETDILSVFGLEKTEFSIFRNDFFTCLSGCSFVGFLSSLGRLKLGWFGLNAVQPEHA